MEKSQFNRSWQSDNYCFFGRSLCKNALAGFRISTLSENNQRLYDEIEEADDKYSDENLEKVFEFYNQQRIDYRIVYSFEGTYQP